MAISVQSLYEFTANTFAGRGTGGDRLQTDFIYALNACLNEISYKNDLDTKLTNVTDISDTISDLDDQQFYLLQAGVMYFLMTYGHVGSDPKLAKVQLDNARFNWQEAKDDYWTARINALNNGDSTGVIGNGYLTQK